MGDRVGLTRVARGEAPGPKRWVDRIDDPARARAELVAGTSGVDVTAGALRMRVGGLPLTKRSPAGHRLQAVRAVIEWPADATTATMTLTCDGASADEREITLEPGTNRVLLFAPDDRVERAATVVLNENGAELLRASFPLRPERDWTVYLVHHSHLDVGYTDPQSTVLRTHRSYLDQVLDLVEATEDWPDDARFRWNIEANLTLQQWMRSRPAATVDTFFDHVRAGLIEVTAMPFNLHTEACSIDELAHLLRFVDHLRSTRDIDICTAMQTDVPGATVGLAQLLVDAGVRYLSVSHNYAGRSVPHHVGGQDLSRPFYWQTPAGDRLLTWFGDTPHGMAYMEGTMLGFTEGYDLTVDLLPEYLSALANRPYPYAGAMSEWWRVPSGEVLTKQPYPYDVLHLRVQGAYCDNAGPSLAPAEVVRRWNEEWESPRLRIATNADFFRDAEQRLDGRLDTFAGDWTDWWADGLGSAARLVGMGRRAQAAVRSAQSLHTVADGLGATGDTAVETGVDAVYDDLALFDEHTWGAAEPWEDTLEEWYSGPRQWHAKSGFAISASEGADDLIESGLERLGSRLTSGARDGALVVVFNPTMTTRTDFASAFVPVSRFAPTKGFQVVDVATGERVPCQAAPYDYDRDRRRSRGQDLTFLATEVPPFGYRTFALVDEVNPADAPVAGRTDTALRNARYDLEYDLAEGCITTLFDRRTANELVAADSIFGFGQYVHDRFTTAPHFNHLSSKVEARDLELLGERAAARHAALIERSSTPLWERLTVRFAAPGTDWLDVTVTLPHEIDRVELEYRLSKPAEENKESAYVAFPFAAAGPVLRADITGGIHEPDAPRVPGSAEHMRAIRHWLTLTDAAKTIAWATVEAPLVQIGNLHVPYAPFPATLEDEGPDRTTVYSWLFNNIWDTNFPSSQGGEMTFRYAVSAGAVAATDAPARSLAAAMTTPLLTTVRGPMLPGIAPTGSFCIADGDVEILTLRRGRHGHDLSVLVQSSSSATETLTLRFPTLAVRRAWVGDHYDREFTTAETAGGVVRASLRPGALSTVLLDLDLDDDRS